MMNAKLTFPEMKEMIELFVRHKLNTLRIGDFELSKAHYEAAVSGDNKTSFQEDPMFFSAPQMPPELEALMESMHLKK